MSNKHSPDALLKLHFGFTASRTLTAAVQLGVFSPLTEGPLTAEELASELECSPRGLRMLLDALTSLELLEKRGNSYELAPIADEYLVAGRPGYIGTMFESEIGWRAWSSLTESIRTGNATQQIETESGAAEFFPRLLPSLHVLNQLPAQRAAAALGVGSSLRGAKVLDLGAGSGVWGIAIAAADPTATVTAQDFPAVLEITQQYVAERSLSEQFEFLPGDLLELKLAESTFDLVLVSNVLHCIGASAAKQLLHRGYRALVPGGRIAVVEVIPNDLRTAPPEALLFALNMLVHTSQGDVYTANELTAWLSEAGFAHVSATDIGTTSPLLVGVKRSTI